MFFKNRNDCPDGWVLDPDFKGRFILGNPNGGTAGYKSSSSAITQNGAQPTHSHTVSRSQNAKKGSKRYSVTSSSTGSSNANLPYIQLTACVAQTSDDSSPDAEPASERGG